MSRGPMRVLLDTHTLLWFLSGDERLSGRAREIIEDGANEALTSVASLWEIAIKHSLGRLELDGSFSELIPSQLEANAIAVLGIELRHVAAVATLPFHHRDPFDRLLVAQALVEDFPIIGLDEILDSYGVKRIW